MIDSYLDTARSDGNVRQQFVAQDMFTTGKQFNYHKTKYLVSINSNKKRNGCMNKLGCLDIIAIVDENLLEKKVRVSGTKPRPLARFFE